MCFHNIFDSGPGSDSGPCPGFDSGPGPDSGPGSSPDFGPGPGSGPGPDVFLSFQAEATSSAGTRRLLAASSVKWSCRTSRLPSTSMTTTSPETCRHGDLHPSLTPTSNC